MKCPTRRRASSRLRKTAALDALPPQRPPEALRLAQRLRPARPRHQVADAAPLQQPRKGARAPPGHILRAIVGEHFLGRPEIGDRRFEHLAHDRAARTRPDAVPHDEAAVVVEIHDEIHPPVLSLEQKREEIALPELIRAALARSAAPRAHAASFPPRRARTRSRATDARLPRHTHCSLLLVAALRGCVRTPTPGGPPSASESRVAWAPATGCRAARRAA